MSSPLQIAVAAMLVSASIAGQDRDPMLGSDGRLASRMAFASKPDLKKFNCPAGTFVARVKPDAGPTWNHMEQSSPRAQALPFAYSQGLWVLSAPAKHDILGHLVTVRFGKREDAIDNRISLLPMSSFYAALTPTGFGDFFFCGPRSPDHSNDHSE